MYIIGKCKSIKTKMLYGCNAAKNHQIVILIGDNFVFNELNIGSLAAKHIQSVVALPSFQVVAH